MVTELILATNNLHKISEFRALFREKNLPIDVLSLRQYPDYQAPQESGKTFEENAKIKALSAASHFGKNVIADDSGLVVPALGDRPGVYSARFAGEQATDKENRQRLLSEMRGLEGVDRFAYFECVLCVAAGDRVTIVLSGRCEGYILDQEKGRGGFGYDPIFCKHDYDKSFAELVDTTKNRISHRGKAFEKLIIALESKGL
jgi:XTP/dITP diphosphohydrolase